MNYARYDLDKRRVIPFSLEEMNRPDLAILTLSGCEASLAFTDETCIRPYVFKVAFVYKSRVHFHLLTYDADGRHCTTLPDSPHDLVLYPREALPLTRRYNV